MVAIWILAILKGVLYLTVVSDKHFSNDYWCWTCVPMLICHPYLTNCKVHTQILNLRVICVWDLSPLSYIIQKFRLPPLHCSFLNSVFQRTEILKLIGFHSICYFMDCSFYVVAKKILPTKGSQSSYCPCYRPSKFYYCYSFFL